VIGADAITVAADGDAADAKAARAAVLAIGHT
jgi:hypothetical protein